VSVGSGTRRGGWVGRTVRGVLVPVLALAAAGVPGGAVWAWWSEPASFLVARGETYMDEEQLGMVFGIEARYGLVGVAGGLVVAVALAAALRRTGWELAVGALLGGAAAAAVSYRVGVRLGPPDPDPDPDGAGAGPAAGDLLPAPFVVDSYGLFASWAVGGLVGVALVAGLVARRHERLEHSDLRDLPRR